MKEEELTIPRAMTLNRLFAVSATKTPAKVALLLDTDEVCYVDLRRNAETRARQLVGLGVRPGDRVGILLPNCIEYFEFVLGAAMMGVEVVPMNVRYKSRELAFLISDSGMVALITCHSVPGVVDFASLLADALPGLEFTSTTAALQLQGAPRLRTIATLDDADDCFVALSQVKAYAGVLPGDPTPETPLLLVYTSGTTANPKGCVISHRAIISNAWAIIDKFAITADDTWWCPLPMFHIGGLLFAFVMFVAGGRYAGMRYFDPDGALDMLERAPPTVFYPLFPTITLPLVDHPRFATLDHSGMRFMVNLAPPDLQRKIQVTVPHAPLFGAFGMTETCGTVAYGSPDDPEEIRFTTCGRALPGWEIKIVDPETHEEVPRDTHGEIAVRGVGLFGGYLNAPELTARQHLPDGYFLTGDVGSVDAHGHLKFHGRFKDQLKVGGENVSALEVESFLATHPAISLAQVVGIPDDKYGEVPAAFIELRAGTAVTAEEVIDFCRNKIARFKIPRYVRIVDEWPMSATKIVKFQLRESLEAELASRGTV
jgi:acyl-CoA synthetase (AMP-forming)/AMP-acid ligase II